jgi:flagellar motor switch protein FliN/FliY
MPSSKSATASAPTGVDAPGAPLLNLESAIFKDVAVTLQAKLGETSLTVSELLALRTGDILKLDLQLDSPVELRLNQSTVALGEIVAVDDHFGVRITEIAAKA